MTTINLSAFRERETRGYVTCRSHPTHDLLIWNYTSQCQFDQAWDDITIQARGLITRSNGEVVARPFQKFFNLEENQTPLPLETFTVTTKMDGSLGILYSVDGEPTLATRGSFTSEQALQANIILRRYQNFTFSHEYTYLFEIIYPQNRIVVNYGKMEDLVLLAVIHTETGQEIDIHQEAWPFPVVKRYDGIKDIAQLRALEEDNAEGFVIRFESGLRVKMKFREYVRLHRILTRVNARIIWEYLMNNQPFDDLLEQVPDEFYQWVQTVSTELRSQFNTIEAQCREMQQQVAELPTRKEQAEIVKTFQYAATVFKMLDKKSHAETIWKRLRPITSQPFREDMDS
jgi:T4 RnlA family RNA ligase